MVVAQALRALDRTVETLLGVVLAVLVLIGGAQVLGRYLLATPMAWAMEASIVLMVWATMLAGYVGVRRNVHLSADFAGLAMKPVTRWMFELASLLLCVVFVCVYGWTSLVVIDAMEGIPFTALPVTQPVLYWSLPASAVLMLVAFAARLHAHLGQRPGLR